MIYAEDSFYTLGGGGRMGLIALSAILFVVTVWLSGRMGRARSLGFRLGIAIVAFVCFVWLSPQIYYAYYQMIFDGLPVQWVIGWPDPGEALRTASFTGPATLSAHGQGVLFWALVLQALRGSKAPAQSR